MANIEVGLFETEAQLSSMIEASGKTVPKPGERANIVDHLDYIIELLGTMVTSETYEAAKAKMANGYNAIGDRIEIVNYMLASGEISGDIDLEPLTVSENGEYMPGAGKGYSRVVVETPVVEDNSRAIIEKTITSIENSEVTTIGAYCFCSCMSLIDASFPSCVTINGDAFEHCSNITSIFAPLCQSIGVNAFSECYKLNSISYPLCTKIGNGAFNTCQSIETAYFSLCSQIGDGAFTNCIELKQISFPLVESLFGHTFSNCPKLESAIFPSCSIIGYSSFKDCINLSVASFPVCTKISARAFYSCINLESVYLLAPSVCVLESSDAFNLTPIYSMGAPFISKTGSIFVPASLVNQYKSAANWSYLSSRITAYV